MSDAAALLPTQGTDYTAALSAPPLDNLRRIGGEMFSWILSSAAPGQARTVVRQLPPPARVLYKAVWKPRFEKTRRW